MVERYEAQSDLKKRRLQTVPDHPTREATTTMGSTTSRLKEPK